MAFLLSMATAIDVLLLTELLMFELLVVLLLKEWFCLTWGGDVLELMVGELLGTSVLEATVKDGCDSD